MPRPRRCHYCDARIPDELGGAARYCNRAHRQRAYEARQAEAGSELQREIRRLNRRIAGNVRVIDRVAEDPACTQTVLAVLREETEATFAQLTRAKTGTRAEQETKPTKRQ